MTSPQLLAICLLAALPGLARADGIYRYVEKDGTIVYTNVAPKGADAKKAKRLEGTFHPAPEKSDPVAPVAVRPAKRERMSEYEEWIESAAKRYRIPVHLVRAVMHAESAFDPNALSAKGASGLMQLMPATATEMYVKDIFDARENIEGGTRYLRVLANEFDGDMVKMVAAYNAGPEAVRKYGGNVPPYAETQAYVRKVISLYFQYKAQAQTAEAEATAAP
jgi:soluble lytic murein transglycosylase-like protein